ncbi:MAG: helix-turn-helix domain-containing protein [Rhizobiales bacterium]|nr:helix-turn-helix domain-containing protein [Hyphomicrobiales bacterium]
MKSPWQQELSVGQIKAARALLGWSQTQLAENSCISVQTIKRLEALGGLMEGRDTTLQNIRLAFEASGIEFVNEANRPVGVLLRESQSRQRSRKAK